MSESPSPATTATRVLPTVVRVVTITALSAIASIVVNAALVWLATAFDTPLRHFSHFRLSDYGTLTVVGVAGAGAGWYLATRYLTTARPTFFRVAIVVTVALWLPDLWLYLKHEPTRGVAFLVVMHAAIALITYNFLVFGAPQGTRVITVAAPSDGSFGDDVAPKVPRLAWSLLMSALGVEFIAGLVGMLYVPFNRPDGLLVHKGEAIYLVHAVLGGVLGIAALAVLLHVTRRRTSHRVDRIAAITGFCGVMVGAGGGLLCIIHPLRLLGMALMFLGVSVGFFGYLIPMIDDTHPVPEAISPSGASENQLGA